ncbi:MAG: helix-turn-helix transcriptional regulator [Proteobacteria bacterium]|nr:helix-turn-helix transcriptional regulator [Pseudomonadota bacterium]
MSQVTALLKTLRRELKAQGITYADVATRLGLSESSIKRMFSESKLSLDRLEALCQVAGIEISDLVQKMSEERKRIDMLTEEQEREVADDSKLLLVAICALNLWAFKEIIEAYKITEHECVQLLAKLDRLKVIEFLPLNRFRLTVANDFRWIPNGPIQRFFRTEVQPDFMKSTFSGPGEKLVFRNGMLSRGSNATMMKKVDKLVAEFKELHDEDAGLPLKERFGSSLLVAMRPWELEHFRKFRRGVEEKVF